MGIDRLTFCFIRDAKSINLISIIEELALKKRACVFDKYYVNLIFLIYFTFMIPLLLSFLLTLNNALNNFQSLNKVSCFIQFIILLGLAVSSRYLNDLQIIKLGAIGNLNPYTKANAKMLIATYKLAK